jgi:hypothetical protein
MKMIIKAGALVAAMSLLAGCVASRSTLDLAATKTPIPVTAQPTSGPAVKIVSVYDQRVFAVDPGDPSHSSLMEDSEISNKAITSRAIARKRNGYGMAWGDVLLPEGETVSAHVDQALTNGLRQSGYRVLASSDAGYAQATPVTAVVKQFWSWVHINPWAFSWQLHCVTEIDLQSALPVLAPAKTITTQSMVSIQIEDDKNWRVITERGLESISTKLADMLKAQPSTSN